MRCVHNQGVNFAQGDKGVLPFVGILPYGVHVIIASLLLMRGVLGIVNMRAILTRLGIRAIVSLGDSVVLFRA